jgi:hypothetical protein
MSRREAEMGAVRKRFDQPDEAREMSDGVVAGIGLGQAKAAKATLQPGWRWSKSVKPIVGGESCQQHHLGYAISGTLHVVTPDGQELEITRGDAYEIAPGHDAWVVGDQPYEGSNSTVGPWRPTRSRRIIRQGGGGRCPSWSSTS